MKMKRAIFITLLCLLCCVSCVNLKPKREQQPKPQPALITQPYILPHFDKVVINGNFNVELVQGKSALTLTGNDLDIVRCKVEVAKKTLYLLVPTKELINRIEVYLNVNNLRSLTVSGQTHLVSKKNCTKGLKILAIDDASVKMIGELNMDSIVQQGHGKIDLRWVRSKNLLIIARNDGPIYVAGAVKKLFAKLTDNAHLEARYLRAREAVILATRKATANVLVVNNLNVYADSSSNVYYHKRPKYFNVVTKDFANALHLSNMR